MIASRVGKPVLANMVSGGRTPLAPVKRLKEMGFSVAIYPALGFLAAGAALKSAYGALAKTGDVAGADLEDFSEFCRLVGFEDVWEFDRKWAPA